MRPLPFKWAYRAKQIDMMASLFIFKASLNLRGDLQIKGIEFDPYMLYAPVAAHEAIRMLFSVSAAFGLLLERSDVESAYKFGTMDFPLIMEQLTDATGVEQPPVCVFLLIQSL